MITWKIEIEIKVSDNWVMDGFDLSDRMEEISEKMRELLPYAYNNEMLIKSKIKLAPKKEEILKMQGY